MGLGWVGVGWAGWDRVGRGRGGGWCKWGWGGVGVGWGGLVYDEVGWDDLEHRIEMPEKETGDEPYR